MLRPDKVATAALANIASVIAPFAIAVAFPVLVTTPVKLALVVTVAALPVVEPEAPVTLPAIGAVTVNPVNVPTLVIAGCAAVVTVAALPDTLPDTSPTIAEEKVFVPAIVWLPTV